MDVDALLEAFQDFEKKAKKEICPVLEEFLCHVAKTGQPVIHWPQFRTYFMFKLEKVMDDFHASSPEQRGHQNPNVEHVSFEEMKKRILKIVDSYNGIPFTIQRLCELLVDPRRNYTGTDKFLRGLEKNVMVVSCVYPSSEKNGTFGANRVNGVMFPGSSSLYSDSLNVNGPDSPKALNRPKLSLSTSHSTNGLSPNSLSKEAASEELQSGKSSPPQDEEKLKTATKKQHPEEEGDSDVDMKEAKRLKIGGTEEEESDGEVHESSCHERQERSSQTQDASENSSAQKCRSGSSCESPSSSSDVEQSGERTEPSEAEPSQTADEPTPSQIPADAEQDAVESHGEAAADQASSPERAAEGASGASDNAESGSESGQQDQV